jgi:hypothetical protein
MEQMPKHLRIVVGLMILSLLTRIIVPVLFSYGSVPAHQLVGTLLSILTTIGLIKGFTYRSLIAWHLAKGLSILGILAAATALVFFLVVRFPIPVPFVWFLLWALLGITAEVYTLWVLFSADVRRYFRKEDTVQQTPARDVALRAARKV